MPMTTREAFERGTATFNAHDIAGFGEVLADDVEFSAPGGAHGQGRAACVDFYAGWMNAFPDAHVDVTDVHFMGDVAVEVGVFTGTHDGVLRTPGGDVAPTGRRVELEYLQVLRFSDAKHVSFHLMFDRLLMLEQLGLVPAAAAAD